MALLLLVPFLLLLVALFATMLRVVFRLGVALAAALLTAWLMPGDGQGWLPVAVFVAALVLLSVRRRRSAAARVARTVTIDQPQQPAASTSFARPGPAWAELRRLADWRTRRRLDAAWDACARYLQFAEGHESETAQLPIKLRKHLPTIVQDCVRHCRTASSAEQHALIADTTDTVEALAARAETRRRELAHAAQGDFRTLKAHLSAPED